MTAAAPRIAIVVPILNEACAASALAGELRDLSAAGVATEIVLVDGGSSDGSPEALGARFPAARILRAQRGRARQMNAGARATSAPILLFLHADTRLPRGALEAACRAVEGGAGFGCFSVAIDSFDPRLRLASRIINLRSRLLCSATGDQAIFARRDLFESVGGFPEIDLCEDLAFMRNACGRARFEMAGAPPAITSARRWQKRGVMRTIALMWAIRTGFHLGLSPRLLARLYANVR